MYCRKGNGRAEDTDKINLLKGVGEEADTQGLVYLVQRSTCLHFF